MFLRRYRWTSPFTVANSTFPCAWRPPLSSLLRFRLMAAMRRLTCHYSGAFDDLGQEHLTGPEVATTFMPSISGPSITMQRLVVDKAGFFSVCIDSGQRAFDQEGRCVRPLLCRQRRRASSLTVTEPVSLRSAQSTSSVESGRRLKSASSTRSTIYGDLVVNSQLAGVYNPMLNRPGWRDGEERRMRHASRMTFLPRNENEGC